MTDDKLRAALDKGWTTADGLFCIKADDLAAALAASATDEEGPEASPVHAAALHSRPADKSSSRPAVPALDVERLRKEMAYAVVAVNGHEGFTPWPSEYEAAQAMLDALAKRGYTLAALSSKEPTDAA